MLNNAKCVDVRVSPAAVSFAMRESASEWLNLTAGLSDRRNWSSWVWLYLASMSSFPSRPSDMRSTRSLGKCEIWKCQISTRRSYAWWLKKNAAQNVKNRCQSATVIVDGLIPVTMCLIYSRRTVDIQWKMTVDSNMLSEWRLESWQFLEFCYENICCHS